MQVLPHQTLEEFVAFDTIVAVPIIFATAAQAFACIRTNGVVSTWSLQQQAADTKTLTWLQNQQLVYK